jgi:RNA polymerase-binding transcription factor DksA
MAQPQSDFTTNDVTAALVGIRGGTDEHALAGMHPAEAIPTYTETTLLDHRLRVQAEKLRGQAYALFFIVNQRPVPCKTCGATIPQIRLDKMNNAVDQCVSCKEKAETERHSGPRRI